MPRSQTPAADSSTVAADAYVDPQRIVLTSNQYYAELYAGVQEYSRQRGWLLDGTLLDQVGWLPKMDGCVGIVGSIARESVLQWVLGAACPVVRLLHSHLALPAWPTVLIDWGAVGRLGARHLLELGSPHFAHYRYYANAPAINECQDGFIKELEAHGQVVHRLDFGQFVGEQSHRLPSRAETVAWLRTQLRSLPLPLAVMGGDDRYAVHLVLAARSLGLRIPEDIAILGAEDLPFVRGAVPEEISSVDVNFREVGRIGSELLDRILQGAKPGSSDVPMLVKVPPKEVVVRQSTSTFVCDHPGVTAAASFVRRHFQDPISVGDVAAQAGMSLRSLQAEYPSRVGCTVKEDIQRARLKRAQFLLERTNLKLAAVASESGFQKLEYLCRIFQERHHTTPLAWRLQHRPTDALRGNSFTACGARGATG